MKDIEKKTFELFMSTFTAKHIVEEVKKLDLDKCELTKENVETEVGLAELEDPVLIKKNDNVMGWMYYEEILATDWDEEDEFHVNMFNPGMIVSHDISLIELAPLFEDYSFLFVHEANNIIGRVVLYDLLESSLFKISLFSLLMELEAEMNDLLEYNSFFLRQYIQDNYYPKRKGIILKRYKDRSNTDIKQIGEIGFPRHLIYFINIREKQNAITEILKYYKTKITLSKKSYSELFEIIQKTRNKLAHGESIMSLFKDAFELNGFLRQLREFIDILPFIKQQILTEQGNLKKQRGIWKENQMIRFLGDRELFKSENDDDI